MRRLTVHQRATIFAIGGVVIFFGVLLLLFFFVLPQSSPGQG
ncbi:hypothetical protein ACEZCY_04250 [Streptacidiphilus sp. N1-12]|uniref:Uncharacterized protein n=2 Tax=Streptacidiphilus alkalitolerans TaxID=3342712 RepID=A0ABV6W8R4_9ACTN